jgi:hypothetical protein
MAHSITKIYTCARIAPLDTRGGGVLHRWTIGNGSPNCVGQATREAFPQTDPLSDDGIPYLDDLLLEISDGCQ